MNATQITAIPAHRNFRIGRTVFRQLARLHALIDENGIPGLLSVMQAALAAGELQRSDFEALGRTVCPPEWIATWMQLIDLMTSGDGLGLWTEDDGFYRLAPSSPAKEAALPERPWLEWPSAKQILAARKPNRR